MVVGCDRSRPDAALSGSSADSVSVWLDEVVSDNVPEARKNENLRKAHREVLQKTPSNQSTRKLFEIANSYYNGNDIYSFGKVSRDIYNRATASSDTTSIAKAAMYLGDYHKAVQSRDSALYYYLRAEKIYVQQADNFNLALINLSKAEILWLENEYFGCESAALQTIRYLKGAPDNSILFTAHSILGVVSNALGDYTKALSNLNIALNLAQNNRLQDPQSVATTLNNIGNVYQNMKDYPASIECFSRALKQPSLQLQNPNLYAVLLDNLAYSKTKVTLHDAEIANLFNESLRIKSELENTSGIIFTKCRMAEYYAAMGDTLTAVKFGVQALRIGELSGNVHQQLMPLKVLATYDVASSSVHSELYIKITDSLKHEERKVKDKFARIQFETDELATDRERLVEQNRTLFLFFIGTIMIGLLLFVIRTQRAKNRELMLKQAQQKANEDIYNLMLAQQNMIEEGRVKEKKRIAQDLHDGVLGRLFGARLNLDSLNRVDGEEARVQRFNYLAELKSIEQDIREISHDLSSEKSMLIDNFLVILNKLFEEQAHNFGSEVISNIDTEIEWEKMGNSAKINLYRIIQESVQNINKYAKATQISVVISQTDNDLTLEVSDNGIGFSVDRKSRGIGLENMRSRAEEGGGAFKITSKKGQGTIVTVRYPKSNAQPAEIPRTKLIIA